jgi:short-subunit dehydrogenase
MNKRCIITGHTTGLGLALFNHFKNKGWDVEGYSRSNGYDLTDVDSLVEKIYGADLFINNAYADGAQLEYLNRTFKRVKNMIVCGSVAAISPDPNNAVYTLHKKFLHNRFFALAQHRNVDTNMLLLRLTGTSYKNVTLICNSIDFWLDTPTIIEIGFSIDEL